MPRTDTSPLHVWQRHHPLARQMAAALPAAMLSLRPRRLVADLVTRFGCCDRTAREAVAIARRNCRPQSEQAHG